jgi:predicted phosphodiesterase
MQKFLSFVRKPAVKFQLFSDLHLEIGNQYESFHIPVAAPYLILAGDIGRLADDGYAEFLYSQTTQFEATFLVLGNHEFYGLSHRQGIEQAKGIVEQQRMEGKVILLEREAYDIPHSNVTVLGCTLWSNVPNSRKEIVGARINDFQKITDWTVEAHNMAHASDLAWLRDQVAAMHAKNPKAAIVVVTHHAPCMRNVSKPEYANNHLRSAFATELLSKASTEWPSVKIWIYGHTHFSNDFKLNGIRIVGNHRGYVFQLNEIYGSESAGFDMEKIVRI